MDDSQGIVAVDVNEPAAIAPTDAITHSSDDEETKSDHNSGVSGKHSDGEEDSVLMVTSTPKAESEASEIKRGRGRPPKVLNKETIIENLDGSKVKRGRGRPPKVVTDTFKNLDGSGIKRGRGRPPKVVTDTFKNLDGSGIKRGRGRPPKVVTDTFKNLDGSGIKRGRGRPPKVVNDETTTNTSTNSVMSSDSSADERSATLTTSSVKRGRGRPRKDESIVNRKSTHDNDDHSNIEHEGNGYHSDSSDELLSEMSIRERPAPIKWKRGRPRKGEVREIIRVAESELDSSDGNDSDFTAEESNSDEDFTAAYRPKLKKVKKHSDGTTGQRGRPRKTVVAARRGRPRKDVEAKQKRGRPRKETKVIRRESGESSSSGSSEDDDE